MSAFSCHFPVFLLPSSCPPSAPFLSAPAVYFSVINCLLSCSALMNTDLIALSTYVLHTYVHIKKNQKSLISIVEFLVPSALFFIVCDKEEEVFWQSSSSSSTSWLSVRSSCKHVYVRGKHYQRTSKRLCKSRRGWLAGRSCLSSILWETPATKREEIEGAAMAGGDQLVPFGWSCCCCCGILGRYPNSR